MKPRLTPANIRARLSLVAAALALMGTALVVRAVDLQLLRSEFYQQQGDARFVRDLPIASVRGMITDRNGEPLAISTPVESLWANPQELLQHSERLPELAEALRTPLPALTQRLEDRAGREFVYLRRQLNPDEAAAILDLGIPGVASQREFRRYYPQGEVMAHLLGYTNIDDQGQEGLELAFNAWLTGKAGSKRVIRDRRGRIVENVDLVRPAEPGKDLTLSIDRRLQHLAYRELRRTLNEHRARAGTVVVLDIPTGEVLAMVNQPSYNPNVREVHDAEARRNRAMTDVLEPGSVIKVLTIAAALETGRYTPETVIPTSPGHMNLSRFQIRDVHNYGDVSLTRLLTKSSNVASAKIANDLSREHMHDLFQRFGLGVTSGSGFPGESAGSLPEARRWGPVEKATIAYGYGLSTTATQLARVYAVFGNEGRMLPVSFIKGAQSTSTAVIDPSIARQVLTMLETVTGPEGTATRANVSGYRVAGKTGTSRKASGGGYQRRYLSVFAGLVPASAPRLAMVVVIDDPQAGAYYGGLVAAPLFQRVMEGGLRLLDVTPDRPEQWLVGATPMPVPLPSTGGLPPEAEPVAEHFIDGVSP